MKLQLSDSMLCLLSLLLLAAGATARTVPPFFNRHEEGLAVEIDAAGNTFHQHLQQLKKAAMSDVRRQLLVGHPNLPGGRGADNAGGQANGEGGAQGGKGYLSAGNGKGKGSKKSSKKGSKKSSSKGKGGSVGGDYGYGDDDDGVNDDSDDSNNGVDGGGDGGGGNDGGDDGGGNGGGDDGGGGADGEMPTVPNVEPTVPPEPCKCTPTYCDCEEGALATDYEFVMVRDEIGSDTSTEAEFGVASGIGLNGRVYNMVYTTYGRSFEGDPIGLFKGFCTVVSDLKGELLCTYEIYLYANGPNGLGGVIVTGPVAGLETGQEFESIVTGAEFDFSVFSTGFLTTVQDPEKPILYSFLSMYV